MNELSNKNDELTAKQKKLVDTIVTTGCSITEAGIIAGYSTKKNKDTARVIASRTLRIPKVQQYMMRQVSSQIGLGAVTASNKLIKLAESAKSEYVQLEASKDILDRVGLRTAEKIKHDVTGDIKVSIDLS
jgi:phage terminase small subunit|tara:strand:- start:293 stop:685 length:393 start_codon:yes stop_codon:yes gene_type:complete